MVCHTKNRIVVVDQKNEIIEELFPEIEPKDGSRKPQLIKKIIMLGIQNNWLSLNEIFDFLNNNHFWADYDKIKTKSFVFRFQMWNFGKIKKGE